MARKIRVRTAALVCAAWAILISPGGRTADDASKCLTVQAEQ
jgi:hypothetical protein